MRPASKWIVAGVLILAGLTVSYFVRIWFIGYTLDARYAELNRQIAHDLQRLADLETRLRGTMNTGEREAITRQGQRLYGNIQVSLAEQRNVLRDRIAISGLQPGDHAELELNEINQRVLRFQQFRQD